MGGTLRAVTSGSGASIVVLVLGAWLTAQALPGWLAQGVGAGKL
jgi:hypothetical protein